MLEQAPIPTCMFKKGELYNEVDTSSIFQCTGRYTGYWNIDMEGIFSPLRDVICLRNILTGETKIVYPEDFNEDWECMDNIGFDANSLGEFTLEDFVKCMQEWLDIRSGDSKGIVRAEGWQEVLSD